METKTLVYTINWAFESPLSIEDVIYWLKDWKTISWIFHRTDNNTGRNVDYVCDVYVEWQISHIVDIAGGKEVKEKAKKKVSKKK